MCKKFLLGNLKGRDNSEDFGVGGTTVLKLVLRKLGLGVWTGFSWLRTGTGGRLL
jgi:hypothetical protein